MKELLFRITYTPLIYETVGGKPTHGKETSTLVYAENEAKARAIFHAGTAALITKIQRYDSPTRLYKAAWRVLDSAGVRMDTTHWQVPVEAMSELREALKEYEMKGKR